jgi:YggT family protein
MLFKVTEPIIDPIRRVVPNSGMMDFSPMLAIMVLMAMSLLVNSLAAAP